MSANEKGKLIRYNMIEGLIREIRLNYICIRPSYFIQNLTSTFFPEIKGNETITLPSANSKFSSVDVNNVGEASAYSLTQFENI